MSEALVSVASAVLPPEDHEVNGPTSPTLKRRQSSEPYPEQKRRRISQDEDSKPDHIPATSPTQSAPAGRLNDRRKSGQLEERKRGQRLFGALLGTLSQSSSSTANKRRTDIENKQRTKLKAQTEEENERRKARLENLITERRIEQRVFDEQSMRRRHQDLLSQAHFLQTTSEPKLYYKPWELLSREEATIESQVERAKGLIEKELQDFNVSQPQNSHRVGPDQLQEMDTAGAPDVVEEEGTNGKTRDTNPPIDTAVNGTDKHDIPMEDASKDASDSQKLKINHDDGGEVVEGEEDTVIY